MKFSEMPYRRPDLDQAIARTEALQAQAQAVASDEEMVALFRAVDTTASAWDTMARLANIHYTQDTRDPYWSGEQDYFDESGPALASAQIELYKAILANPHAPALDKAFGPVVTPSLKNAVLGMDSRVQALQKEENALSSQYQKLYGGALVEFDGKTCTIPQLAAYKESGDRAVRRAAYEAEAGYFDRNREQFDSIYSKMVENRNAQARILGYADYSELSYVRMNRLGYGPAQVKAYRDEVRRSVVPTADRLVRLRWQRAGLPADAKFWDNAVSFASGNPRPRGTEAQLMAAARQMYHELSPETGRFIDFMQENELFDVQSRPGKMSGGYEEMLPDYGAPFIFANWNGTSGDVDVLTHEAGHAFEAWMAAQDPDILDFVACPGMESAEIHSMSMEFLTAPWHGLFFGPDTAKYELAHAEDALFFLPYGCIVDEFQHIMYQQPGLTPDQRNRVWLELEHTYRPWLDFGDLPFYSRGAGWQRQLHIYESPFYYIDYCLAQTIALQFFACQLADPADAWRRYMALVRCAGRKPYAGLVEAAGLQVPFVPGSLARVTDQVAGWIESHQTV